MVWHLNKAGHEDRLVGLQIILEQVRRQLVRVPSLELIIEAHILQQLKLLSRLLIRPEQVVLIVKQVLIIGQKLVKIVALT